MEHCCDNLVDRSASLNATARIPRLLDLWPIDHAIERYFSRED